MNGFLKDTRFVKAPEGILSAKPDEMIVTALTGTTVAELHKEMGRFGQGTCLPEGEEQLESNSSWRKRHQCAWKRPNTRFSSATALRFRRWENHYKRSSSREKC